MKQCSCEVDMYVITIKLCACVCVMNGEVGHNVWYVLVQVLFRLKSVTVLVSSGGCIGLLALAGCSLSSVSGLTTLTSFSVFTSTFTSAFTSSLT